VESSPGNGSTFYFELPTDSVDEDAADTLSGTEESEVVSLTGGEHAGHRVVT
jgi:hypothetical protein